MSRVGTRLASSENTSSCTKIDLECMPFPFILCSCFLSLFLVLNCHIHLNVEKSTVAIGKTIAHSGFFYDWGSFWGSKMCG